jgi:cell wall-associated NlpC family hydrolase
VQGGTQSSLGAVILREAQKWAGVPYCFGGGGPGGPSHGAGNTQGATQCGGSTQGFDCTGLTIYAVYQATGKLLTHDGSQAANAVAQGGKLVSKAELQPGDLVYFGGTFSSIEHVGVYAGGGKMWDANTAFWIYADGVRERTMASVETTEPFVGAVRFQGAQTEGGGGYDIAFQSNTGQLWEIGEGPGAIGHGDWHLGMMPGTSPAIALTPGGGYDIAFQANTGQLWEIGEGPGAIGHGDWHLGTQ